MVNWSFYVLLIWQLLLLLIKPESKANGKSYLKIAFKKNPKTRICFFTSEGRPHTPLRVDEISSKMNCPKLICPKLICPKLICPKLICPKQICSKLICPKQICSKLICPTVLFCPKMPFTFYTHLSKSRNVLLRTYCKSKLINLPP